MDTNHLKNQINKYNQYAWNWIVKRHHWDCYSLDADNNIEKLAKLSDEAQAKLRKVTK